MVDGGAGSIAQRVADELGDAVRLNAPVRSITQRDDHVVVEAGDLTVGGPTRGRHRSARARARHRVRSRAARRSADAVPQGRRRSGDRRRSSSTTSRSGAPTGFSGQTAEPGLGLRGDARRVAGVRDRPACIASFTFGAVAERVDALDPAERRQAVVDALDGPASGRAPHHRSTSSRRRGGSEEWTRGCSMAHFPPGSSRGTDRCCGSRSGACTGPAPRPSTTSHGAIDGAVRSGDTRRGRDPRSRLGVDGPSRPRRRTTRAPTTPTPDHRGGRAGRHPRARARTRAR